MPAVIPAKAGTGIHDFLSTLQPGAMSFPVIPAKAGIFLFRARPKGDSRLRGNDE